MNVTTDDLTKFLQRMETKVTELSKSIKSEIVTSNENLGKEITSKIEAMNEKIEEVKKDTNKLKNDNVKMKEDMRKSNIASEIRLDKIESKFEEFEKEQKNIDLQMKKREYIMKKVVTEEVIIDEIPVVEKTYAEKTKEVNVKDVSGNIEGEIKYKSTWAWHMSQCNLEEQLKQANETAARLEGGGEKEKEVLRGRRRSKSRIDLRMGDSLHDENDWPWRSSEDDWDGVENRGEKNEEKKRKEKEKRRLKVEKAAFIGQCTLGIGPVRPESYEYFYKITGDFELSKKMAAAEFLNGYMKFYKEEMSDLDISDTKISAKGDNILYIVMDSPDKI